jgi:hypothetical protein
VGDYTGQASSLGDIWQDGAFTPAGTTSTTYNTGCGDPNTDLGCWDSTVSSPDNTCYRVNAKDAFCLETLGGTTSTNGIFNAYIPLAEVPQRFANSIVTVRLFDPGDVTLHTSTDSNNIGIYSPEVNPDLSSNQTYTEPYHMSIAAVQNSGYGAVTNGAPSPPWWAGQSATQCSAVIDYPASSYQDGGGAICPPYSTGASDNGIQSNIQVASNSGNGFTNGTWLEFHVAVPASYPSNTWGVASSGSLPVGQDWWKVHYYMSCTTSNPCSAGDTTTWEISGNTAPVHLIGQ